MWSINLIPPEAAQRAAARRRRLALVLLGVIYVVFLAFGTVLFNDRTRETQVRLVEQQDTNQALEADIEALAPATQLEADLLAGVAQLEDILASDIAWGRFLNDLGRVIPDRVWLTSLTIQAAQDIENPDSFGSVSINGTAFDYPDSASWLRKLDSDGWPAVDAGWILTTAQESLFEDVTTVMFSSVGTLTAAALDSRIDDRIPKVPE